MGLLNPEPVARMAGTCRRLIHVTSGDASAVREGSKRLRREGKRKEQERVLRTSRPEHGLHTASLGSSQAPTDAVHNPAVPTAKLEK